MKLKHKLLILSYFLMISSYSLADDRILNDPYYYSGNMEYSANAFGGIGLIQMPSARFSKEGEFTFGISRDDPYRRIYATAQVFPFLEATLKYTEGTYKLYRPTIRQTWKDKGIDLKIKLLDERKYLPALAIGIADFGGTGAYSGEYLVASKRLNNFDFTAGLGWGRLAGSESIDNPVGDILGEKWFRRGGHFSLGGKLNLGNSFSGPYAGIFGGVEYFTPIEGLSIKLEYDSNDYSDAEGKSLNVLFPDPDDSEGFVIDTRFNAALHYGFTMGKRDKVDLNLGFVHGNTLYAGFNVHSNLNYEGAPKFVSPKEILNKPTVKPYHQLNEGWQEYLPNLIMWQLRNEGFIAHKVIFNDDELIAEVSQGRFKNTLHAVETASRVLGNNSPTNIRKITVVNIDRGIETIRTTTLRKDLVEQVRDGPADPSIFIVNEMPEYGENTYEIENDPLYPNFYWTIKPHASGTLQHQQKFYFYQLEALFQAEYAIKKGLYVNAIVGIDIDNNFDEYTYHVPDGELYYVRQNRRLYLTEGESGIRQLDIEYTTKFHENVYGRFHAGLLEWMYGGVGGEVLYVPDSYRWAVGVETHWLKQRDWDQKFSFQDFETTTAFVNFHYRLPFYDLSMQASVGKFLGTDKGVSFQMQKRFKSGAKVGASIQLTDCDARCVGEGSFNKAIFFSLPMDLFYRNRTTREITHYGWSPLTKNAGQKAATGSLYEVVNSAPENLETVRGKPWNISKIFSGFSRKSKQSS
ncbi:MAG: hypothetical protein CBC24_01820 [Candidatus Pelagibacter sp. TMED64]|nr:hypothetical protein [Gammaproteobacteria bacterium]OUU67157.1 MAG: hypothetical protein CBC24_01820 [Candidatus Pelagibacter sp. TMED64]